jgi:hypothetical protein
MRTRMRLFPRSCDAHNALEPSDTLFAPLGVLAASELVSLKELLHNYVEQDFKTLPSGPIEQRSATTITQLLPSSSCRPRWLWPFKMRL